MKTKKKVEWIILLILAVFISLPLTGNAQHGRKPGNLDKAYFKLLPPISKNVIDVSVIKQDFWLSLRDSVRLDCSKFYPSEPNPYWPDGYPTVVMVHGYGDRKETLEGFATAQASYGYVVYTYSMRGQGISEGLSNLISTTEADDLAEFINFVKQDFSTGLDTSKILIMGGSQGAIVPFMASCRGMKVNSIIGAVGSPEFATSWIENGSIKMTFLWTIDYTPDTARYTKQVDRMSEWVYACGLKSNKWDSLTYYLPINRDFANIVNNNVNPVLIENSWQDYFFNAKGSINNMGKLKTIYRTYFGAVMGHGGDISETENLWHMDFFNDWFYYFLWGINNGLPERPKYHYAFTTYPIENKMWSFVHDSSEVWPPNGIQNMRLYFKRNNLLSTVQETSTTANKTFKNEVASGYNLKNAVYDEFKGTNFNSKFKVASIYFETPVLTSDVAIIGTPKINLNYKSNVNICQYNFQIFEVTPSGQKDFVNRVNFTDRNYIASQTRNTVIDGQTFAHIFKQGNKIMIVVTNLDRTPKDSVFLETNPYVLPVMKNGTNTIYLRNTYIDLPVLNTSKQFASFKENEIINLEQNYPNPFNPVTNISFVIPNNYTGMITLKIYDVLGREMKVLVNDIMTPGKHTVKFDGTGLSSGIYFYRITAGNYSDIKTMLLIK